MTQIDIINAIMAGANVSRLSAANALREHIANAVARDRTARERRESVSKAVIQGMLCCGKMVVPEELAKRAVQQADLLIAEIDK
jgi:hypothetical protein